MADKTDEKKAEAKEVKGPRVVVTLAELVDKYGGEGEAKYSEIAQVVNGGNPLSLAPDLNQYAPDIAIHSEVRSKVDALLS